MSGHVTKVRELTEQDRTLAALQAWVDANGTRFMEINYGLESGQWTASLFLGSDDLSPLTQGNDTWIGTSADTLGGLARALLEIIDTVNVG